MSGAEEGASCVQISQHAHTTRALHPSPRGFPSYFLFLTRRTPESHLRHQPLHHLQGPAWLPRPAAGGHQHGEGPGGGGRACCTHGFVGVKGSACQAGLGLRQKGGDCKKVRDQAHLCKASALSRNVCKPAPSYHHEAPRRLQDHTQPDPSSCVIQVQPPLPPTCTLQAPTLASIHNQPASHFIAPGSPAGCATAPRLAPPPRPSSA